MKHSRIRQLARWPRRQPMARLIAGALVGITLAGCADQPVQPTPRAAYDLNTLQAGHAIDAAAAQAGAVATGIWWHAYGDAQLDNLMELAGREADSIQAAEARLRQADAVSAALAANLRPAVNASATAGFDRFPDHASYPAPYAGHTGSDGLAGIDLSYHLDFWSQWHHQADAAKSRAQAAGFELADARLVLQTALVLAYLKLDSAWRLRALAVESMACREGVLRLLAVRQRAGIATDLQSIAAHDAVTLTRAELTRFDAEIAIRQHEIAALLGQAPGFADALTQPHLQALSDPAPLSRIPASLLGYRPDVAARRSALEAAAQDVGAARAAFYPDINLLGFAGLQSLGLGYLLRAGSAAASTGPAVTLPLFDGGRLQAQLGQRAAGYDQAVIAYNAAVVAALQQAADGIVAVQAARARQREAQSALAQHRHALALLTVRRHGGLATDDELFVAQTTLLLSERRAAEADAELAGAQVTLIRALGGAWAPSISPTTQQDSA